MEHHKETCLKLQVIMFQLYREYNPDVPLVGHLGS